MIRAAALERELDAGAFSLRRAIDELERAAVSAALARSGGNVARAARLLGEVGRGSAQDPSGTLRAMIKRLGLGAATTPAAARAAPRGRA